MSADFVVLFDILDERLLDWHLLWLIAPFGLLIAGVVLTRQRSSEMRILGWLFVVPTSLAIPLTIAFNYYKLQDLRERYLAGQYSIVEGNVANFASGHGQRFDVGDRHFIVEEYSSNVGFHGAGNISGRCVRILFTEDGDILWLGERPGLRTCPIASE